MREEGREGGRGCEENVTCVNAYGAGGGLYATATMQEDVATTMTTTTTTTTNKA